MRKRFLYFIITFLSINSCTSGEIEKYSKCRYTKHKLLLENDTSLLEIKQYIEDDLLEVLDKGSNIGARGIYKFDKNNTLRFYSFLISDSNDYVWSQTYDTLGNILEKTGGAVLLWYFNKPNSDSIGVTAFLSILDQEYKNIKVSIDKSNWWQPQDFKSPIFSNVIGCKFIINTHINDSYIYIQGDVVRKCFQDVSIKFIDSIRISNADPAFKIESH